MGRQSLTRGSWPLPRWGRQRGLRGWESRDLLRPSNYNFLSGPDHGVSEHGNLRWEQNVGTDTTLADASWECLGI